MSINLGNNNISLVNQGALPSNRGYLGTRIVYGYNDKFNTFIGGLGGTLTTEAALANKLSLNTSQIADFIIDNNNIYCNIYINYTINSSAFVNNNNITYYLDLRGNCTYLNSVCFHNNTNGSPHQILIFPNVTGCGADIFSGGGAGTRNKFGIICLPQLEPIGVSPTTNSGNFDHADYFENVYVNSINETNNLGDPDPDIASAISSNIGTYIRYSTNTNTSENVTGISTVSKGSDFIELTWDAISHTNTIDYYIIFENGNINTITASTTSTITGLNSLTTYNFKILAVDEMGNSNKFSSNYPEITTL